MATKSEIQEVTAAVQEMEFGSEIELTTISAKVDELEPSADIELVDELTAELTELTEL